MRTDIKFAQLSAGTINAAVSYKPGQYFQRQNITDWRMDEAYSFHVML
jgi:hypothetical protein